MASTLDIGVEIEGVEEWEDLTRRYKREVRRNLARVSREIGERWLLEARRRIPVRTGEAQRSLRWEIDEERDGFTVWVVSDLPYVQYIEFGTDRIAGGRVKALGDGPVTDEQAVKDWPALRARRQAGGIRRPIEAGRVTFGLGRLATGQQMPFIRPAWAAIEGWAIGKLEEAIEAVEVR